MTGKSAAVAAAISAPSIGPAVLVVAGLQIPIASLVISLISLLLARYIQPRSQRSLSLGQERALTALLALILVVVVSGEFPLFGDGKPMSVGMATAWALGLGTSGLLAVDLLGKRLRLFLGVERDRDDGPPKLG